MLHAAPTFLRILFLALGLVFCSALVLSPILSSPVVADDDDDDGGGDDDDDDYFESDDDDDDYRYVPPVKRAPPAPISVPLPEQAPDQVVVEGLDAPARDMLLDKGFVALTERGSRVLFRVPGGLGVTAALEMIGATAPAALAAPNSYYRSQAVPRECSGALCGHWEAVGWPPVADPICRFEPFIGVVDTGVNLEHDMLRQADVTLETLAPPDVTPSEHKHGTAIVAMFVGSSQDRVPGLAPAAQLLVVDPFGRVGTDERSDVFALVQALERLGEAGVDVVSLSLAGPDNAILAAAIKRLQAGNVPVVAAVGNAGPRSAPLFPAAYPDVVAVTAVDGRDNIYRRAVQGAHVSFAAPGVNIPTAASISGVRPQSGTSFAVPFVTTALAAAMADGKEASEAIAVLAETSRDLGAAGRDEVFGWGLVKMPSPC